MTEQHKDDGGPAFPRVYPRGVEDLTSGGMSLRDWYAGMALQGLLASRPLDGGDADRMAENASALSYIVADAMLKARGAI